MVKAIFKGTDSLGYIHGKVYDLKISKDTIMREDGSGYCVYSNIESFLDNWIIVTQP